MATGEPIVWTQARLRAEYRARAPKELVDRLEHLLTWSEQNGRFAVSRAVLPVFGVVGDEGWRVFSVRERARFVANKPLEGRITLFPRMWRYASAAEAKRFRSVMLQVAKPSANKANPASWDVTSLRDMTTGEFRAMTDFLQEIGPLKASDSDLPARKDTRVLRVVRDSALTLRLKALHDHRCQLCGRRLQDRQGWAYSETHHIRPLGGIHRGADASDNLIVVCPNHHALLDFKKIPLTLSGLRKAKGHAVNPKNIVYHNSLVGRQSK